MNATKFLHEKLLLTHTQKLFIWKWEITNTENAAKSLLRRSILKHTQKDGTSIQSNIFQNFTG